MTNTENEMKTAPVVGDPKQAPAATAGSAVVINRLKIQRFRGIKDMTWMPMRGLNVILGGGDVGKTTIIEAISLLFSPSTIQALATSDYNACNEKDGFLIEAVVTMPSDWAANEQKSLWPWLWNGKDVVVPSDEEDVQNGEPVYRFRVRGTDEFETAHEVLMPDESVLNFSSAMRRAIGLVRLSGEDRNDRDLRLVHGSALDRLISDKGLRSRLTNELGKRAIGSELSDDGKTRLSELDKEFRERNLPSGLDLAVTGSQGISIASLIGLTADNAGVRLPLASWGTGTRRLAALTVAEEDQGSAPLVLVDEVERGLEPYRQQSLCKKLQESRSQVFVTTHSPTVIAAAADATFWHVNHDGGIGIVDGEPTKRTRKADPNAFLAKLTIVAEGPTEVGFVDYLLARGLGGELEMFGIHVTDGGGQEKSLGLLEALAKGGVRFGGFVDNEQDKYPTRWQALRDGIGEAIFRWKRGCVEENVIPSVPHDKLEQLIASPENKKTGVRFRNIADRLGLTEKDFATLRSKGEDALRRAIIDSALGIVPPGKEAEGSEYEAHKRHWFKSVEGGKELAAKMFQLGVWQQLRVELLPFCNAVRRIMNLAELNDLPP